LISKYIGHLKETYNRILDLPDSPRKIALGVAMGAAMDFFPVPFISIPISYILAKLIRVNAIAAVLTVIFFKWAVPFFFTFNVYIGSAILRETMLQKPIPSFHLTGGMEPWLEWIKHLGHPFLLGAAINSILVGIITYFIIKRILDYRRKRRSL